MVCCDVVPDDPYRPPSAELSEPPRPVEPDQFHIVPVLVSGIGVDIMGTSVVALLLSLPFTAASIGSGASPEAASQQLLQNPVFFWVLSLVGAGMTLLAGYVAGRWAGCRPEIHGTAAGVTSLVLTIPSLWGSEPPQTPAPDWFLHLSLALHLPLAVLGGWIAGRRAS